MNFGESVQAARGEYRCDKCSQLICTGEQYRRWVWKVAPRHVHVMREHLECPPDEFKEEVEDTVPDHEYQPLQLLAA